MSEDSNSELHPLAQRVQNALWWRSDAEAHDALLALRELVEQFETLLRACEKFEGEMSNDEFVHFGEFKRATERARASFPAKEPE